MLGQYNYSNTVLGAIWAHPDSAIPEGYGDA